MDNLEIDNSIEILARKIGSTLCLATEILGQNEPLRHKIRTEVVRLISNTVSLSSGEALTVMQNKRDLKDSIGQLLSCSALLKDIRVINQTTLQVLERDFAVLGTHSGQVDKSKDFTMTSAGVELAKRWNPREVVRPPASSAGRVALAASTERRTKILQLLGERGPSSVSDLAKYIEGCSDKTIQRELVSMLSVGLLKKTGERRWSRYSLLG